MELEPRRKRKSELLVIRIYFKSGNLNVGTPENTVVESDGYAFAYLDTDSAVNVEPD